MKKTRLTAFACTITFILIAVSCQKEPLQPASQEGDLLMHAKKTKNCPEATFKVYAENLNNPRGLKFDSHGILYVAEGGTGGTDSSVGLCEQVIPPVGPYLGSPTGGRISKIDQNGGRQTVADNFPSSQTAATEGSLISGVADVAFIGHTLYAIFSGAGCSHGVPSVPNAVVRVNDDGTWEIIANLSAWQQAHPVKNPEEEDFEPDGTWYSMISLRGNLYAVEPNHGEMVRITPSGQISRVIDISASQGHIVPTALAYHGNFYVGNLNPFPIVDGSSNIYKITPSGQISIWAKGFTTVLGICFDNEGRMYVLENTTGNLFPTPGTGKIIRVSKSGKKTTILSGLNLPTAMTFGPDGKIYVSNWGFGPPALGGGQILQVDLGNCKCDDDDD